MKLVSKTAFMVAVVCLFAQAGFAADDTTTTKTKTTSTAQKRPSLRLAQPNPGEQNIHTKLSKDDALKIALQNVNGEVVTSKLDSVGGNPCYDFTIKSNGSVKDVIVDATSGQVVIVGN
jgi:uncharacterized membrane protein YkoI